MADYYATRRGVLSTESVVDSRELDRLRELAAIGQAYEAAMRLVRDRQAHYQAYDEESLEGRAYKSGWLEAMREFAQEVERTRNGAVAEAETGSDPDF